MSFDHGELNVPLHKRGDIDAQIDKYKADQAKAEKAERTSRAATLKTNRADAKAAVAALPDQRITELMAKFCLTRVNLLRRLNSIAHWQPDVILRGI